MTSDVSIGIALAPANDAGTLLRMADLARYRAKDLGRRTYSFFEAESDEGAQPSAISSAAPSRPARSPA